MSLAGEVEQHRLSIPPALQAASTADRTLAALIAEHEPRVRRLAHRLLGWRDAEVDDVVQEVFLAALDHLPRFRGEASIATWLTRMTLNRCRTTQRRRWLSIRWLNGIRMQRAPRFSEAVHARSDDRPMRDETNAKVRDAVQALSPRDREVIVLFHLEALPVAEIAALLDARPNAIEVRLHRARQKLRLMLADLANE